MSGLAPRSRLRQLRRTLTLLQVLSDGQLHGLRALADRLGVSTRTIRRDVDALDEIGFAIEADHMPIDTAAAQTHYQLVNSRLARVLLEPRPDRRPELAATA